MFCSCLKYSSFFKITIPPNKQAKRYFFRVLPNVLVLLTYYLSHRIYIPSVIQIGNLKSRKSAKKRKELFSISLSEWPSGFVNSTLTGCFTPSPSVTVRAFIQAPLMFAGCNNTPTLQKRITLLPSLLCAIIHPLHCFQSLLLTNRSKPLTPSLKFLSWQSHLFILQLQATCPVVDPAFLLTKCTSQDCCIHPFLNVMHVLMPLCFFLASGKVPSRKRNLNRGSLI